MTADIRTMIVCLVMVALGVIAGHVWRKYLKPYLDQNELFSVVKMLVSAVEAEYGRHNGDEKLKAVLERLSDYGFDINSEIVLDSIKSAWYYLNMDMISNGLKPADGEEING